MGNALYAKARVVHSTESIICRSVLQMRDRLPNVILRIRPFDWR